MRIHSMATALVAAAAVGGLLAGCGGNTATSPATTTAPAAANNAPATGQQQHNQADVVFLQQARVEGQALFLSFGGEFPVDVEQTLVTRFAHKLASGGMERTGEMNQ